MLYGQIVAQEKLSIRLLKVVDLPDGKASTITQAFITYLQFVELSTDSSSSFVSDGTSIMIGCHSGVAARMCELNAQIIPVHCICHRLALAIGQASNSGIMIFFFFSCVSSSTKANQEAMSLPELKILKGV